MFLEYGINLLRELYVGLLVIIPAKMHYIIWNEVKHIPLWFFATFPMWLRVLTFYTSKPYTPNHYKGVTFLKVLFDFWFGDVFLVVEYLHG